MLCYFNATKSNGDFYNGVFNIFKITIAIFTMALLTLALLTIAFSEYNDNLLSFTIACKGVNIFFMLLIPL